MCRHNIGSHTDITYCKSSGFGFSCLFFKLTTCTPVKLLESGKDAEAQSILLWHNFLHSRALHVGVSEHTSFSTVAYPQVQLHFDGNTTNVASQ